MPHHLVEFPELVGRRIKRFMFSNNPEWKCITVEFTDETLLSFKLEVLLNAEAEFCVRRNGDLEDIRILEGQQIKPKPSS